MTGEEFKPISMGLKAAYTQNSFLPDAEAVRLWFRLLEDLPAETVRRAAYRHIALSRFPPSIAELREACLALQEPPEQDWSEGWTRVTPANGRYGRMGNAEAMAALKKADPLAAETAERLGWRLLCLSETPGADRAGFRSIYHTLQQRTREERRLPPGLQALPSEGRPAALEKGEDAHGKTL